jgi:hypothetical protein
VEAFDFAVAARPVRLGRQVADLAAGEQLTQRAVLHLAEAVSGQQPLRDDPLAFEEGERSFDEAGDGLGVLVVVELDVGESGVLGDDRLREVGADSCLGAPPVA